MFDSWSVAVYRDVRLFRNDISTKLSNPYLKILVKILALILWYVLLGVSSVSCLSGVLIIRRKPWHISGTKWPCLFQVSWTFDGLCMIWAAKCLPQLAEVCSLIVLNVSLNASYDKWVSGWMSEWVDDTCDGCMNVGMIYLMAWWWMNYVVENEWMNCVMNEWYNEWMVWWMNGVMNWWMVGWMNVVINEWWIEWWIVNETLWNVSVVICKCVCNVLHCVLICFFQGHTCCTHDDINPMKCTKMLLFFTNPKHFLVASVPGK